MNVRNIRKVGRLVAIVACALTLSGAAWAAGYTPVVKGGAKPGQFIAPQGCNCHPDLQAQWSETMHAKALTDPIYQLVLAKAKKEAGPAVGEYCETCHAPGAIMTGEIATAKDNPAINGITCDWCHQVTTQTANKPANTSLGFPKGGPDGVRRAQIMDPAAMHAAEGSELFGTSEFCGACHNVDHPTNGLELESTYTEWQKSSYASEGVSCQQCHMSPQPGTQRAPYTGTAATGAQTRDNLYAMTFAGANVAQGNPAFAIAMLKQAAEVKVEVPEIVAPGASGMVKATVTNTGAGHSLPTGLTEIRQMWLDIYTKDGSGKIVELGKTEFGTILKDKSGKKGVDVWDATAVASDNRIKAGDSFVQEVTFEMPAGLEQAEIFAELNYASAPDEVAKAAGVENPTTLMASAKQSVYGNEQAKATAIAAAAAKAQTPKPEKLKLKSPVNPWLVGGIVAFVLAIIVLVELNQRKKKAQSMAANKSKKSNKK